ncbi:nitroreductase family protein [Mesobacillus harenae]|uniref:nitroreductase family protein n=1 Tax=Mesobacillus harenae TaxID=2213203 RepID=UPI001580717C|nr:nitroreductase family protein [Mesobacillus harenae]
MADQTSLSVEEAIETRHSIRRFTEDPIPKKEMSKILELVRLSPSAWNLQPWRLHVVIESTLKNKLEEAAYGQKQVGSAPAVFVVISDMEDVLANLPDTIHPSIPEARREEEVSNLASFFNGMSIEERGQWGLTQTNIAFGFLMMAVQGLGYSSVPMLGFDQQKVKELLDLPEHAKFAGILPVGKAANEGYPHHRFELEKIVTFH